MLLEGHLHYLVLPLPSQSVLKTLSSTEINTACESIMYYKHESCAIWGMGVGYYGIVGSFEIFGVI